MRKLVKVMVLATTLFALSACGNKIYRELPFIKVDNISLQQVMISRYLEGNSEDYSKTMAQFEIKE